MMDAALTKTSKNLGDKYEEGGVISQVLLRQTVRKREGEREGGWERVLVTKQAKETHRIC